MATYAIQEGSIKPLHNNAGEVVKMTMKVSFNEGELQYYETEELTPEGVDKVLTEVAEQDEARDQKQEAPEFRLTEEGKIER